MTLKIRPYSTPSRDHQGLVLGCAPDGQFFGSFAGERFELPVKTTWFVLGGLLRDREQASKIWEAKA